MNKLNGTIHDIQIQSGEKNGKGWKRTTVVIETNSKYNNLVPVSFFNATFDVQKGQQVEVEFFVGGRSWQDDGGNTRYFAQIDGNKLDVIGEQQQVNDAPPAAPQEPVMEDDDDDLPF